MRAVSIQVSGLSISTGSMREIVKDLNMHLSADRVTLIGRNGVGKSTLLKVLAGQLSPSKGQVSLSHSAYYIEQFLDPSHRSRDLQETLDSLAESHLPKGLIEDEFRQAGLRTDFLDTAVEHLSHGELRKLKLLVAKLTKPEILILDEPTQDLDPQAVAWLKSWLPLWEGALLVASHRKSLLEDFEDFFIMSEGGCSYFKGDYESLEAKLAKEHEESQRQYLKSLNRLMDYEEHILHISRRRARKKQYGRISELGRATPKQRLNQKRDYAQFKHGRMKRIRDSRIADMRDWSKSHRRSLQVDLAMEPIVPQDEASLSESLIELKDVSFSIGKRALFEGLSLSLSSERLAIYGANGTGKTTLLQLMMGELEPSSGRVRKTGLSIGYIAQGAANWMLEDSLLDYLSFHSSLSAEELVDLLLSHKFPLALAERPLKTLSPGERSRAALICLFQQEPTVQLLVLDEPTYSLDLLAQSALEKILSSWRGGLVISSHDSAFLEKIGVEEYIQLE